MLIPPDTICGNCGRLLMSAGHSDRGGTSLVVHADTKLIMTDNRELNAICPSCNHHTPAVTVNQLLAAGWKG